MSSDSNTASATTASTATSATVLTNKMVADVNATASAITSSITINTENIIQKRIKVYFDSQTIIPSEFNPSFDDIALIVEEMLQTPAFGGKKYVNNSKFLSSFYVFIGKMMLKNIIKHDEITNYDLIIYRCFADNGYVSRTETFTLHEKTIKYIIDNIDNFKQGQFDNHAYVDIMKQCMKYLFHNELQKVKAERDRLVETLTKERNESDCLIETLTKQQDENNNLVETLTKQRDELQTNVKKLENDLRTIKDLISN